MFWVSLYRMPSGIKAGTIYHKPGRLGKSVGASTGAPKLFSDLFLEKCAVFIGTVARFSRNKSLLISFGAPVVHQSMLMHQDVVCQ